MKNTDHSEQDLDWLAFQYVSGELSESESREFEERLGSDLAAGEALARQVMVCEAVVEACAAQPAAQSSTTDIPAQSSPSVTVCPTSKSTATVESVIEPNNKTRWASVLTAAVCISFAVWAGLFSSASPDADSGQMADNKAAGDSRSSLDEELTSTTTTSATKQSRIVEYWIDVKQDLTEPIELTGSGSDELADLSFAADTVDISAANEDSLVPDWMLAAVSTDDMTDELDMPEETIE